MSRPLVSVVIPTYNQPALLAETLETVFGQTFTDYEVVVVNDGSTDDTESRLRAYGDRIRLITQENGGIGAARNRGVDEARGKYVALLDHDDLWIPEKLATQVEFLEKHPECVGASVPWAYSYAPQRPALDVTLLRGADGLVPHPVQTYARFVGLIMSSALMFNRERAAGLRYETERQCNEDMAFQMRLVMRGEFGLPGDKILMIYRIHPGNATTSAPLLFNGTRRLREIERAGGFEPAGRDDRRAVREFLGGWGRLAAVEELCAGRRLRGARVYLRELPHQLRLGQWKFLLIYPPLLLAPRRVFLWRWPRHQAHQLEQSP